MTETATDELLPCPFCGSEVIGVGYVADISAYRACCQCGVLGSEAASGPEAIAVWNRRDHLDAYDSDQRIIAELRGGRDELVEAISGLRGWIQIWSGDNDAGLTPTASSLIAAMATVEAALAKAGAS